MRNLTLIIPGLLGPDAHFSDDYIPRLPALEAVLARSKHSVKHYSNYHRTLAERMGIKVEDGKDVPVAAITRFIDDENDTQGIWLRADPVHLSPDRDGLILMDSFILNLSQHDALAIADEVNKVIEVHDWKLEVPFEDRWYIRVEEDLHLTTTELSAVVGNDIAGYLPRGRDSSWLHNLLNEIQMQLYSADINQLREKKGELPVNSVWFWGLGSIREFPEVVRDIVFTEDIFVRSIARMTDVLCHPVPQHLFTIHQYCGGDDNALVVLPQCQAPSQYQNLQLWHKALLLLENSWFEPALEWLQKGKLDNLRIISDAHEFQLHRFGLKKFWRKPVGIGHYRTNA